MIVIAIDESDPSKGWYVVAGGHIVDAFYGARQKDKRGSNANVDATEDGGFPCSELFAGTPKDVIQYFKDTGNALNDILGSVCQIQEAITSVPDVEAAFYAFRREQEKRKPGGCDEEDDAAEDGSKQTAEERKKKKAENRVDKMYRPWLAENDSDTYPSFGGFTCCRNVYNTLTERDLLDKFVSWCEEHALTDKVTPDDNNRAFCQMHAVLKVLSKPTDEQQQLYTLPLLKFCLPNDEVPHELNTKDDLKKLKNLFAPLGEFAVFKKLNTAPKVQAPLAKSAAKPKKTQKTGESESSQPLRRPLPKAPQKKPEKEREQMEDSTLFIDDGVNMMNLGLTINCGRGGPRHDCRFVDAEVDPLWTFWRSHPPGAQECQEARANPTDSI